MTEQNFEQMRRAMVTGQLRTTAVNDPRVVAAMAAVAREAFVPAALASLAYVDTIIPLGNGRALPPAMVPGKLLTEARVRAADRVLVIGAGAGYAAAVAAKLAAHVIALEEDAALAGDAPLPANVTRVSGPLAEGWAQGALYDVILCDGAIEHVPDAIVAQLAEGGRLATGLMEQGLTRLALGRKDGGAFGLQRFAEVEMPVLPGFARPHAFSF